MLDRLIDDAKRGCRLPYELMAGAEGTTLQLAS
jgi:hypothetical protein